jgi:UPF0755 protein
MWRAFLLMMLTAFAVCVLWTWQALQQSVAMPGEELLVVMGSGETPGQVLRRLDADGHLHYSVLLRLWVRLENPAKVQVGEYRVAKGATARDLIDTLYSGRAAQRAFTLIEGWSIHQLREALRAEPRLVQAAAALDDAQLMSELGFPGEHPEGRFAPDTYFFAPYASTDLDILKRAHQAQLARIAAAWQSRAPGLPYASAEELLIMASIVERETGQAAERPEIAGVFVRRMQMGMRLQTDPTVIYGLGRNYQGNLTRAHLQQPTPYNTYTIDGLPPTPIAMPGDAALRAAAHPADGDSLYFVGRGDGSHQFSSTLEQHNRAVREYQLRRRDDYHSAPKP